MQRLAALALLGLLLVISIPLVSADAGDTVTSIFTSETQNQNKAGLSGEWLRNAHAKQHGCIQAFLTPLDNLSPALAQGIFSHNTSYPAFIRFSNGMGRGFVPLTGAANQSDVVPDIRGMGIKLFNVSETIITPGYDTQVAYSV
jgi:hypothetical protein